MVCLGMWVFRDFNDPRFSWDHTPMMKSGHSLPTHYEDFLSLLDEFSLVQIVNENTRDDNVLDYLLTTNPTLVNEVQIFPGIADHFFFFFF